MDVGQQWAVSAARAALVDAGWPEWDVDPERVAVILGNALGGEKHYQTTMRIQFPELARDLGRVPVVRVAAGRGARGGPRAVAPAVGRRLPGDHRGHDARRAGQRDGRPGRQPVQLPRTQLHHRRGLRLRPRRDGVGGAGPRRPPVRRRGHRRCRPQHGRQRVREVLQDRGAVGDRHPALRRRRRRVRHGRGCGTVRAQAARRRRARREPDLRRPARPRRLQRRQGQGHHRTQPGRSAAVRRAGLGERGPRPLDDGPGGGARHLHRRR